MRIRGILFVCGHILFSILLVCCGTQPPKTRPTVTPPIPLMTVSPAAPIDPKIALRENIMQVLGTVDGRLPRLTKISYSVPETGDITITWAINGNMSRASRKAAAQLDATNILKALENNKTRFVYVILVGTFPTQDQYGNTAEVQAISLGFNKSKLDKVDWEDFQPSDIYELADVADIADEWK